MRKPPSIAKSLVISLRERPWVGGSSNYRYGSNDYAWTTSHTIQSAYKCIIACKSSKELVGGISQLDKLSAVAIKWRQELLNMLCRSVKDEDIAPEEADAYYGTQAATQETIDLYLDFYKQILADIRELLTGRRSVLADEFSSAVGLSIRQQGQSKFKKLLDTGSTKSFIIDPDDPGAALFFDLLRVRVTAKGGEITQVKRVMQGLAFGSLRSTDTNIIEKAVSNNLDLGLRLSFAQPATQCRWFVPERFSHNQLKS